MRILLLANDKHMNSVLTEMLVWMGHEVQRLEGIDALLGAGAISSVSAGMVLVHLRPRSCDAEYIESLTRVGCCDLPVVVIADRNELSGSTGACPSGVSVMINPPITVGTLQGIVRNILEDPRRSQVPCAAADP